MNQSRRYRAAGGSGEIDRSTLPACGDTVRHIAAREPIEESLRALAHPARRVMLELVFDHERPATELANAAGLSKSAASQHLKLLRDAGLMRVRIDANRRLYRANVEQVARVAAHLDAFWASPLAKLKMAAEAERRRAPSKRARKSS